MKRLITFFLWIVAIISSAIAAAFFGGLLYTHDGRCDGGTCVIGFLMWLIGFTIAFIILLVIWAIIIKIIRKDSPKSIGTIHRWKQFRNLAQMAEQNREFKEAIKLYSEAINFLSSDFTYLNDKQGKDRDEVLEAMSLKVNQLSEIIKNGEGKTTPPNHT